jgi:hypothetical protein
MWIVTWKYYGDKERSIEARSYAEALRFAAPLQSGVGIDVAYVNIERIEE